MMKDFVLSQMEKMYQLQAPTRRRPPGKQMEVLCLGLSREAEQTRCALLWPYWVIATYIMASS